MQIATQTGGVSQSGRQASVRLWMRLVGDFEAQLQDGRSVLPVSKKARALLAMIAAHMPQPIRRDTAASLLWSNKPRDHAANSLRQALRELQITIAMCGQPGMLLTGGGRLSLRPDSVWIDLQDPGHIRWKGDDDAIGPLLLCQNLQGLDPAFDAHLEKLWKNLVFHQAFVPVSDTGLSPPTPSQLPIAEQNEPIPVGSPPALALVSGSEKDAEPSDGSDESVHGQGWRIAVLPFRSLGAPLEGGLSLGMAEEISAAMAKFRMPRLVATGSFWDGSGPASDAMARCRAFGLDYAINGTIQTSGSRIRVTVSLLDVSMNFEVVWASKFEGTTDDLFTLQDTVASHTVAQIDPELLMRHQFRRGDARTPNAQAHQLVMQAVQSIYRPDRDRFMLAETSLKRAIELDGEYAAAYAWLAYWHIMAIGQGWSKNAALAGELAGAAAERAVVLDPLDARGVTIAGHVKAYLLHDVDAALMLHERATSLNPNLPIVWTLSAWSHVYSGDHERSVREATNAVSLSPSDPHIFFPEHARMMALMFMKRLDEADHIASGVLELKPGHASAWRVRTAILGHLGRPAEASNYIGKLRDIDPDINVATVVGRVPIRPWDRDYYADGLRKAGLPE